MHLEFSEYITTKFEKGRVTDGLCPFGSLFGSQSPSLLTSSGASGAASKIFSKDVRDFNRLQNTGRISLHQALSFSSSSHLSFARYSLKFSVKMSSLSKLKYVRYCSSSYTAACSLLICSANTLDCFRGKKTFGSIVFCCNGEKISARYEESKRQDCPLL